MDSSRTCLQDGRYVGDYKTIKLVKDLGQICILCSIPNVIYGIYFNKHRSSDFWWKEKKQNKNDFNE